MKGIAERGLPTAVSEEHLEDLCGKLFGRSDAAS